MAVGKKSMSFEYYVDGISFQGSCKKHASIQVIMPKDTQSMMSLSGISPSFIIPSPDAIYQSEVIFTINSVA